MKLLLLAVLLLLPTCLYSQDLPAIERELVREARRISYWAEYDDSTGTAHVEDSLARANSRFMRRLLHYTATEPASLTYAFAALRREHITITTSADGRFRIYSWDSQEGGTMRFFNNVFQFRAGAKVAARSLTGTRPDNDAGKLYFDIFQVQKGSQTYYLAYGQGIYSSHDSYQHVKAFAVEGGQLNPEAKLIQTGSGLRNTLGFAFDFFSVVDRPERPVRLITYDPKAQVLAIPVVWADGKVTDKRIRYGFNGAVFAKVK
ncbi:hypothetical protein [Hymenobacter metallicola]|uniref:Uncharacterized protein n=1 Tax=Hymenobacter metallicola TaxID=2563114 RepID=A0A4Z0QEK3_9BACT|nr:hypothetical protein [Hymenobacter metallicola]TGE28175.1 hypothetical protein E5K02_01545 [Hymenobacter metallicola]